ncbi:MAG: asparagine synthase (glutamine-hydrolyzing) [Planctomycetes bacterium]|nr:asparagine synthase (glutamine-hydrolyzing) [Planctomycetota bacterium]
MCGIAGALGLFGADVVDALGRAARAMAHRGPDGFGAWTSSADAGQPRAHFEHRRLSIIDLSSAASQPMRDAASGVVVCFNGEIYNFRELRRELEGAGATFRTSSDTEVLLESYVRWGEGCLERLRGMFALALFDPARRCVLLARDRLGEKPLYWVQVRGPAGHNTIVFASEVRALLASGLVERKLAPDALATYLWNGFVYGPQSIVAGVRELPAGSFARVELATPAIEPKRYWTPPRSGARALDRAELAEKLQESVRLQLESDVPLGVFLSGGVDSSAVANLAVRAGQGRVRTFNIAFDVAQFDESPHARAVAQALGTEHTELRVSGERFLGSIEAALRALDQPTFDGVNSYVVSRAVRDAGVVVALAGTGGDELFGGYASFRQAPRGRRIGRKLAHVPRAVRSGAVKALEVVRGGSRDGFKPQTRWGKLGDALDADGDIVALYQVAYALFSRDFQHELRPALDPRVAWGLPQERRAELAQLCADERDLHAVSLLELSGFLGERLLRDTDAAGMAASIEVRLPLVDFELVELVAQYEAQARFEPLGRKQALRDAGLAGLDPALFERPKSGFEMPFERWCRNELAGSIDSVLSDAQAVAAAGLAPAAVQKLWKAFQSGAPGLYWSRVWSLFALVWWCREHRVSA